MILTTLFPLTSSIWSDLIWSSVDCLEYSSTKENRRLAQCQKHSAKREKQLAKALLRVTLGEHHLVKADLAKLFLPSVFYRALEKHFCWVLNWHLAKNFWKIKLKKHPPPPPPHCRHARHHHQWKSTVWGVWIDDMSNEKNTRRQLFAEWQQESTRQIASLPSAKKTLGKPSSLPSVFLALGKELIYRV